MNLQESPTSSMSRYRFFWELSYWAASRCCSAVGNGSLVAESRSVVNLRTRRARGSFIWLSLLSCGLLCDTTAFKRKWNRNEVKILEIEKEKCWFTRRFILPLRPCSKRTLVTCWCVINVQFHIIFLFLSLIWPFTGAFINGAQPSSCAAPSDNIEGQQQQLKDENRPSWQ